MGTSVLVEGIDSKDGALTNFTSLTPALPILQKDKSNKKNVDNLLIFISRHPKIELEKRNTNIEKFKTAFVCFGEWFFTISKNVSN
jgi:hypothetical protein